MNISLPFRTAILPLLLCTHLVRASEPAAAKPQAVDMGNQAWTQPLLGVGVKTSDVYTDGHIFLTAPIWSTIGTDGTLGGDYVFLEPYSSLGDQGELATSLGLSWRHLFSDQPVNKLKQAYTASLMDEGFFIGGNIFVDMLRTHADNKFWQLGLGVEAGTRYIEARANYYLPFDDERKLAATSESTQTYVTQSSQSSTRYQSRSRTAYSTSSDTTPGSINQQTFTYGDPFATVNSIQQDVNISTNVQNTATTATTTTARTVTNTQATTTTATTTTTTTQKTIHSLFEEGMQGWDAELALLIPWVDQWCDVQLFAGYFSFDNQPFGPQSYGTGDLHGWKAGVEIRPVPALVIDAIWYEDKRLTGSNWNVAVGLEIPMDKTWKDALKSRRRHLVERLAEPVHRQNDAIKVGNSEEDKTSVSSTSHTSTSTKTSNQMSVQSTSSTTTQTIVLSSTSSNTTQRVVIKDNIIFVNNGAAVGNGIQAGSASGDGTAERPVNTVQSGANLAGNNSTSTGNLWTAYVQGGGATYTEVVTTKGSTAYFGSSQPIQAQGGKKFGGTSVNPVIDGAIVANGSTTPAVKTVSVQGFTILHGKSSEPSFSPIDMTNVSSVSAINNTIKDAFHSGISVQALSGFSSTAVVSNNVITNSVDNGIVLLAQGAAGSKITAALQNNTITTVVSNGIGVLATGTSQVTADITGNAISFASFGLSFDLANSTTITATMNNNRVTNSSIEALTASSFGSSKFFLSASNNVFSADATGGFGLVANDTSAIIFSASGNQISQSGTSFSLNTNNSASLSANLTSNGLSNSAVGVSARANNTTAGTGMNLFINSNTILNSNTFGIELVPTAGAVINVNPATTLLNNVIQGSGTGSMSGNAAGNTGSIMINGTTFPLPGNAP